MKGKVMNCKEIIEKHLKDNGFDGLVHLDTECGCHMGDAGLFLCDAYANKDCEPAYKHEDESGWIMRLYAEGDH
jgi:hypothetical protein